MDAQRAWPRRVPRELPAGTGERYLALRIGIGADTGDPPPMPRREPAELIEELSTGTDRRGRTGEVTTLEGYTELVR